jgi:AsmA protein
MAWRTLPRPVRFGLWSVAGLIGLLVVGSVVLAASFDPETLKPRVASAVEQATGRELTLHGRIRLGLSLQPTLIVRDVSLANPPGFSRPQMATFDEMDLKLALIPLLGRRIVIDRLVLHKPDILLETDRQGRPNWQFAKRSDPGGQQPVIAGSRSRHSISISMADVRIEQGRLAWREDATGHSVAVDVTTLRTLAVGPQSNLHLTAEAVYNSVPFTLTGDFGPLAALQDPTAPWPLHMQLEAAGASLTVDGTIVEPLGGRGYAIKLAGAIPNLATLAPLLSRPTLPPLHDVSLSMQLADAGAAIPAISDIILKAAASDLTETMAGLKLDSLEVSAIRLDQPVHVAAHGNFGQSPATLDGSLGVPAGIITGGGSIAPIPIDLRLQALGSGLEIKGNAAFGANAPPSVQAEVRSDMIDADALAGAFATPSNRAPAAPSPPPANPAPKDRMIPDTPLPFNLLHLADADLKLYIAHLKFAGEQVRAIAAHVGLHGGRLQLDPIAADLPEGHLDALLNTDATGTSSPTVALRLRSPGIALQRVFTLLREPAYISGSLNVEAELHGAGANPHAIASTLDGSLVLSMANGTIDNRVLGSTLGSVLREVNLLDLVGRGGTSQIRCFVARLNASHGIVTVRPLVFASSLLTLDGDGSLNLGTETLDMRVRPQARVAGTGLVVPVRVGGSFRSPSTTPDPAAMVAENAGPVAGSVLGSTTLGLVAGALGAKQLLGGSEIDCGAALGAVRGTSGAAASAKQDGQSEPQQRSKPPNVGGALKQLFR